jgi:hypothetical protein
VKIDRDGTTIVVCVETDEEREALIAGLDQDRSHPARRELYDGLRAMRSVGLHPATNCGPLEMDLGRKQRCPTCGVLAGTEPDAETLAEIRELWPTYPQGFWR